MPLRCIKEDFIAWLLPYLCFCSVMLWSSSVNVSSTFQTDEVFPTDRTFERHTKFNFRRPKVSITWLLFQVPTASATSWICILPVTYPLRAVRHKRPRHYPANRRCDLYLAPVLPSSFFPFSLCRPSSCCLWFVPFSSPFSSPECSPALIIWFFLHDVTDEFPSSASHVLAEVLYLSHLQDFIVCNSLLTAHFTLGLFVRNSEIKRPWNNHDHFCPVLLSLIFSFTFDNDDMKSSARYVTWGIPNCPKQMFIKICPLFLF